MTVLLSIDPDSSTSPKFGKTVRGEEGSGRRQHRRTVSTGHSGTGSKEDGVCFQRQSPPSAQSWKGKEQETAPLQVHAGGGSSSR